MIEKRDWIKVWRFRKNIWVEGYNRAFQHLQDLLQFLLREDNIDVELIEKIPWVGFNVDEDWISNWLKDIRLPDEELRPLIGVNNIYVELSPNNINIIDEKGVYLDLPFDIKINLYVDYLYDLINFRTKI